jgi:hypothetical protein
MRRIVALLIFWIFYVGFTVLPFIIVINNGISFYSPVSDVYVSAFVTASCVFLGFFVNAFFRTDLKFDRLTRVGMTLNIVWFLLGLSYAFGNAIAGKPNVAVLSVLASGLNENIFLVILFFIISNIVE